MVFWQIDMFEPTRLLPAWDGIPLIDAVRSHAPGFIPWAAAAENNFRLLKIEAKPLQPQQQNQSHCEADGYIFISCPVSRKRNSVNRRRAGPRVTIFSQDQSAGDVQ